MTIPSLISLAPAAASSEGPLTAVLREELRTLQARVVAIEADQVHARESELELSALLDKASILTDGIKALEHT